MDDAEDIQRIEAASRRCDETFATAEQARNDRYALMRELNGRADDPWPPGDLQHLSGLSRETLRRNGIHEVEGRRRFDKRRKTTTGATP